MTHFDSNALSNGEFIDQTECLVLAKSTVEKKKQRRKARQKKPKISRSQQSEREMGWFDYEEACHLMGARNPDQALKFLNRAAKALPNEEKVFQFIWEMGLSTENVSLELDALAGMERIGKMTDEMKVNRVFILFNQERYKECTEKVDAVLENFSSLKLKNKRKIKAKIEDIKKYCQMMILPQEDQEN